ncbi:LpqB family beta-propeller domain-containing protein [Nonomuraea angiospora]|uniref:LpqB family beta-propeller domain-containing protein n=1 Tax=Nonomuraea angiospora TaxID=46172 RepID=UPI0029B0D383|nr:LpqB family beta-propeller domain-containing protein [Nonomuraea angiospora]MDX3109520.1 LpqB family beta-propeller domain-containing protein [Nonomuraea angiospora]
MTTTRRRERAWRLGAVFVIAVAVVCAGSGCTVIPVTGPITLNDAGSGDPLSKPFHRMIAFPPDKTWNEEQTIRGLQAAMAAYADDPTILPQYLTPEARAKWSASGPVTVVDDAFEVVPPSQREDLGPVEKVMLKGQWVARINEDDSYAPTTGKWEDYSVELVKAQDGGYLVKSLPNGLLLTSSDVSRAYRATNLYYLNGNSPNTLVVDRVRLRLKPTETYAQTILQRLLKSPTSALQGAVTTSFPSDTKVESIRSGEDRVVINLSGPLDTLDLSAEDSLRAQIRYSLNKNEIAKGRVIEIQVNGESYSIDRPDSDDDWLDATSDAAYYISKGAVHYMSKDGPAGSVPGPAGQEREGFHGFALSKDGGYVAAQTSTGISVAALTQSGRWQEVIQGKLTPPTWHRDGSLWTYDQTNGALLRYDPLSGKGPQRISAPKLTGLDVTRLRIARDGVRVAVTTGQNTVQIGALTGGAAGMMLGNFQALTTTEGGNKILDVAWEDDEHLLVLVEGQAGQVLNEINVGDGEIEGVPLKEPLASVAAVKDRVLAEAKMAKGNQIMELSQDRQSWTTKIESGGSTPLFPLG